MRSVRHKVAFITGAGSGIGRALAIRLAQSGCSLALNDVDADRLVATKQLAAGEDSRVTTHVFDVADRDAVSLAAGAVSREHGCVDLLINNAAVVVAETLEDVPYEDFEWLMGINFWGVVHCTRAFLPFLKERPEARIVNIASVDALLGMPNNAPYCAAKAAVRAVSESLAQELVGTTVGVTCVIPGGVQTNIHRNARFFRHACADMSHDDCIAWFEGLSCVSADHAAEKIIRAIRKKRPRVLIGSDARLIDLMSRALPASASACVGHVMRNMNSPSVRFLIRLLAGRRKMGVRDQWT